jgi:O-acetylhomoserine (thiol)-lyase
MEKETKNVHGGRILDTETGATQFPVHLSSAFAYPDSKKLADVFAGTEYGHVYSRITNPTLAAFEQRLTALEGGVGTISFSTGMAAVSGALLGLLSHGDNLVAARSLFGGTFSLFTDFLPRLGIEVRLVDEQDLSAVRAAVDGRTRALYLESVSNPAVGVADIEGWSAIAQEANAPLVVDNTCMPGHLPSKKLGIALSVYSTTKWIDGHGRAVGGAVTDTGAYKWRQAPHPHLATWTAKAGPMGFLAFLRNRILRDLGGTLSPHTAWIHSSGLDSLQLRFDRHCDNALALAKFLDSHPSVARVLYPGLESSPHHARSTSLFGGRNHGAVLSFDVGSAEAAWKLLDGLKLASRMTNLGDSRTLALHVWSTINAGYGPQENATMGVTPGLVRVSVGLENAADLVADFRQALDAATAS